MAHYRLFPHTRLRSTAHRHSFLQSIGVMVQVSVVVTEDALLVKLVNRQATGFAKKGQCCKN